MVAYMPLVQAMRESDDRVSVALVGLSFAEIRTDVTTRQLVDTVNELHAAVGQTITVANLFLSELNSHDHNLQTVADRISELSLMRAQANASAYRDITTLLLEQVRLSRSIASPSMASCSLIRSDSPLPTVDPSHLVDQRDRVIKSRFKIRRRGYTQKL